MDLRAIRYFLAAAETENLSRASERLSRRLIRRQAASVISSLNYMIEEVNSGKILFYNFYPDKQKQQDPSMAQTGLFFFRGKPGAPFAIICPGGGFSDVGSLHEGFPLAQEISRAC